MAVGSSTKAMRPCEHREMCGCELYAHGSDPGCLDRSDKENSFHDLLLLSNTTRLASRLDECKARRDRLPPVTYSWRLATVRALLPNLADTVGSSDDQHSAPDTRLAWGFRAAQIGRIDATYGEVILSPFSKGPLGAHSSLDRACWNVGHGLPRPTKAKETA